MMDVERHKIIQTAEGREEWLRWRRRDVTASSIGALFGCHPFTTALRLYVEKRGLEFPERDDRVLRRGRWMEPAVALAVSEEKPDWQIEPAREYVCAPSLRLGCSPDFFIQGDARGIGVLQTKTVAPHVFEREWAEGPPFWIQLQVLTEMLLTDVTFGVVAALKVHAFDMELALHEMFRHPGAENRILSAVKLFWDNVDSGNEPDPDYGRDSELIRLLVPSETKDKEIDLSGNNRIPDMLAERALRMARMKRDKDRCQEIESEIRFCMRDAAIVTGLPDWRITFKTSHVKGYTVEPRDQRTLRIYDKRENLEGEQHG